MSTTRMFQTTSRIIRGIGTLEKIGAEISRLRASKVMVITDPGIIEAGIVNRLTELLGQAGMDYTIFSEIEPDPRLETAVKAAEQVRKAGSELVVGIGGGSAIDIAKVAAVLVTNSGDISTFFGIDLLPRPGLPLIIIPTTAGTGSEVTPIAILSDEGEKLKKGIVSPYLFPTVALLDAELTVGLPPGVTAASGIDALIHAVEAYTSVNADSLTDLFACRAMKLIYGSLLHAFHHGQDLTARSNMLEGSMLAGMAFANAGVTAVHAFAYPIGAEFHIPHGIANAIMLTPVMEFNMTANPARFAAIAQNFGIDTSAMADLAAAQLAVEAMEKLGAELKLPRQLSTFGVKAEHIPGLAQGVMKVTRLLANNPRPLTAKDAEAIYHKVL